MSNSTTMIFQRLRDGDQQAMGDLIPRMYDELKRVASNQLAGVNRRDVLQTTAIVHEAYLRLIDQHTVNWQDRSHFLAIAATVMRRVILDHIRNRQASKRGGKNAALRLDTSADLGDQRDPVDLLAFDEVLTNLEQLNARHARIVEMRFFAGMTIQQTALALGISEATVKNDWRTARAWLAVELET